MLSFLFLFPSCVWDSLWFEFGALAAVPAAPLVLPHHTPLHAGPDSMSLYPPQLKHNILSLYRPRERGHGFDALARRFAVKGGGNTLRYWYSQWDGTTRSLQIKKRTGRPRLLTAAQVSRHVRAPILAANRAHRSISYPQLLPAVRAKTGKLVSIQTLRRYGRKELCERIAEVRRQLQRMDKSRVLFLDESGVRLNEAPTHTLVLPSEQQYVLATETSSYAKRFDMIAAVNVNQVFAPCIYTPSERSQAGVKGINTDMLVDFIYNTLGQETAALDNPPLTLVVDRARIHNEEQILQAFRERGGHVMEILKIPSMSAKRLSPLDNALFHVWKERVRQHGPLTLRNIEQVMADEWNRLKEKDIRPQYKHCGLMRLTDPYFDCPDRTSHQHAH